MTSRNDCKRQNSHEISDPVIPWNELCFGEDDEDCDRDEGKDKGDFEGLEDAGHFSEEVGLRGFL